MTKYQPPIAEIIKSIKVGEDIQTTLKLDEIPSSPIAPALIYSKENPKILLFELHSLTERNEGLLTFVTFDTLNSPLVVGKKYDFYSQWTSDQLELTQDKKHNWHKKTFTKKDMVTFKVKNGGCIGRERIDKEKPEGASVDEGGWDHEHCELCWETISALKDQQHFGYTDGDSWICPKCYKKSVMSG